MNDHERRRMDERAGNLFFAGIIFLLGAVWLLAYIVSGGDIASLLD